MTTAITTTTATDKKNYYNFYYYYTNLLTIIDHTIIIATITTTNINAVTGATTAIIGEAGPEAVVPLNEFYAKFDELIAAVNKGGVVMMDGNQVGTALGMASYKTQ